MNGKSDSESFLRDNSIIEIATEIAGPSLSPPSLLNLSSKTGAGAHLLVHVPAPASSSQSPPAKGTVIPCEATTILSTPGNNDKVEQKGAMILDLPIVCGLLKFQHFRGTSAVSVLGTKRRRRVEVNVEEASKVLSALTFDENFDEYQNLVTVPVTIKSRSTTTGPRKLKRSKKSAFNIHKGDDDSDAPAQKRRKKTSVKSLRYQYKGNVWNNFQAIFNWARKHTVTRNDHISRMAKDWDDYNKGRKCVTIQEISDLFSISTAQLHDFKLFDDLKLSTAMWLKLRNLVNHLVYSDLSKLVAFREWQSEGGSLSRCAHFLAEAHGTHLRSDIVDKHCQFLSRPVDFIKLKGSERSEFKMRKKVFVRQIKDALTFGRKFEDFMTCVNDINPNWNVVQITAMAFANNRFGYESAEYKKTPALFLTSFLHLPGDMRRSNFVTYLKEPRVDPASSSMSHGILEEFNMVMAKNRHISDNFRDCRQKYWDIRAEHNKHLSDIIHSMEEDWLGPFSALFPGNVKDTFLHKKIFHKLQEIQTQTGRKLTEQDRVFLYKLMENYGRLGESTKTRLRVVLQAYLQISSRRSQLVTQIVSEMGKEIPANQERWPTIIILDSELEHLPWDWMPMLRTTSVTRMPSVAAICNAIKVAKISRPNFPEIVDMTKATFIVNPDQTLKSVQNRLECYFRGHTTWAGVAGRKPTLEEMEVAFQKHDVMIYCGHGNGVSYFPDYLLQKLLCNAIPILMGCSSAQYRYHGPKANSYSVVSSYLMAGCLSIVGFLWEVTDVECDRVTVDMLQRWLPGSENMLNFPQFDSTIDRPREKCLATAMLRSRTAATQFLTEAALVNYGLPVQTK